MNNFLARLEAVIPGGAHTYSRGRDQFPSNAPPILAKGKGAYVYDPRGNKYLDYGMGLRSVSLGYAFPAVNRAVRSAIGRGNNLTLPHIFELDAAETVVSLIPGVEMVKFAKNGSNATTGAVKLARAFTGRRKILIPESQPFFSFDDWFISSTPISRGIPANVADDTVTFRYGDSSHLGQVLEDNKGDVACVIMEPLTSDGPCTSHPGNVGWESARGPCVQCRKQKQNYLREVRSLCDQHDVVLIMDEMVTGFRWSKTGASTSFDVVPDLTTFGKAIANGYSLAFVGGRSEIMSLGSIQPEGAERTFLLSSTHGAEMASLAAFLRVVRFYESNRVIDHFWEYGRSFRRVFAASLDTYDLGGVGKLVGPDCLLTLKFETGEAEKNAKARTLFLQEMAKNGVLMPWIAPSWSHGEVELKITERALEKSLPVVAKAIRTGDYSELRGAPTKPVFRRYN